MEILKYKQEIPNELLAADPNIIGYVTDKMVHELCNKIADILCDGRQYLMKMEMPEIDRTGADNAYCATYRCNLKYEPHDWIPFIERLPDDDTFILFCATYDNKTSISISKGSMVRDWWKTVREAAWMPLPEPYKGEQP